MDTNRPIFMSSQPSVFSLPAQMQQAQRIVQQRPRPEQPKIQTQTQDIFSYTPNTLNDYALGQANFAGNSYVSDFTDYSPLTPKSSEPSFSPAEFATDSDLDSWPALSLSDAGDVDDFGFFTKTEPGTSPSLFSSTFPVQGRAAFESSAINPLQLSKDHFGIDIDTAQQQQQQQQQLPKQQMAEELDLFTRPELSSIQNLDTKSIGKLARDSRGAVRKASSGSSRSRVSDASGSSRKRKISSSSSLESSTTPRSPPASKQAGMPVQSRKKTAHNVIEKRYRTNLNEKILALRDSVPALRVTKDRKCKQGSALSDDDEVFDDEMAADPSDELGGLLPAHKLNKATILSKATEYICHLEKQNSCLEQYISSLECTLRDLQDQGRQ